MSGTKSAKSLNPTDFDSVEPNQFFNTVIQRSLSGILIFHEERIVFSNPALQSLVGFTEEEILRMNPFELVHPDDRNLVRKRAAQRIRGLSPPDDYEFRIIRADGKIKWVHVLATSIIYRGRPSVLANILDNDERKRAEVLSREANRLRTTLLDSLPHPAMLIRRDHIILAANRHALDLGARIGKSCGRTFGSRAFGDESSGDSQPRTGSPAPGGRSKCKICRADKAFKSMVPMNTRAAPAFGRLLDLFWVPVDADTCLHYAIDVTEQRKIEQAIRDSEERYRLITDTMHDGLSIQDCDNVITQVNRRLCEMTGFTQNELVGRPLADLLVKRGTCSEDATTITDNPSGQDLESFIRHSDGHNVSVSVKIDSLVDDHGNLKGSFAFFSDISELRRLRSFTLTSDAFEKIVGHEVSMRKLFAEIVEVAACDFPVLIQGESGVGKELVAQAVHNQSHRKDGKFVPVSCAALPESLLESELFGHIKGAFTGAIRDKKGRFELAHGGTIFLDEIGELSPAMQVKLLRVLQEGTFERVGDTRTTKVDVRIVSATNKNLEREMKADRFRPDLFYRLSVMPIQVPPLRERKNDIPLLADYFISSIARRLPGHKPSLSNEALVMLMNYHWPGNVRELQNAIQSASVKCKGGRIQSNHLPSSVTTKSSLTIRRSRRKYKLNQSDIREALRRTGGNKLQAARLLGVNRSTLYRFLSAAKQIEK